jgi:hypothetical protein
LARTKQGKVGASGVWICAQRPDLRDNVRAPEKFLAAHYLSAARDVEIIGKSSREARCVLDEHGNSDFP